MSNRSPASLLVRVLALLALAVASVSIGPVAGASAASTRTLDPAGLVSGGSRVGCAIKLDRTVACWAHWPGESQPQPIAGHAKYVSVSFSQVCVIRLNDMLECQGFADTPNIPAVPADLGRVRAVDTGKLATCVITWARTVRCWSIRSGDAEQTPPADLGEVSAISVGWPQYCAIKLDGTPVCWGSGIWGEKSAAGIGTVKAIATGYRANCVIRASDDRVLCWGNNDYGVLDVPADLGPVKQIGLFHGVPCALTFDDATRCWGYWDAPTVPAASEPVVALSVGGAHACLLYEDGDVVCAGSTNGGLPILPPDLGAVADFTTPATTDNVPSTPQSGPVVVTLTANDTGASGLSGTSYEIIGADDQVGPTKTYDPANKPVLGAGERIRYRSTDGSGNVEADVTSSAVVGVPAGEGPSCTDVNLDVPFNTSAPVSFRCAGRDLTYAVTTPAGHGSVSTPDASGAQYAPNGGFKGADSFEVTATDAANRTATFTVRVTVAGPRDLTPDPNDQLTGQDADTFWDLDAGETDTFTLRCDPGKIAVDGHPLIQAVDQGTGQPADVQVLESRRIDRRTYEFRLSNPASGRAQGHLAVACISETTFKGHELEFRDGPSEQVWIGGFESESESEGGFEPEWSPFGSATLSCGDGWTAVAPGFRVNAGSATLTQSQPSLDGTAWTFTFYAPSGFARIDTWISCLSYADAGRTVLLRSYRATTAGSVGANDLVKRDTPLDCEVGFVGLVGGFSTGPDLRVLGQETQAKRRLFWLQNTSSWDQSATFSLLCLGLVTDTTSSPITAPGVPAPTTTPAPTPTTTPTPLPDSTLRLTSTARSGRLATRNLQASGSQISATVQCPPAAPCAGTITLTSGGRVIATGTYAGGSGASTRATLSLTKVGRRKLARSRGRLTARATIGAGTRPISVAIRRR